MAFELKCSPDRPYHYIIAVGIYPMTSIQVGEIYLKYSPISFTNDDIEKMQHAVMLSKDKLFKTTGSEAIESVGCSSLAHSLTGIKLAAQANQCTLHHFSCEEPMTEEHFDMLFKHPSTHLKQLLKDSRIRG